jgi:uncharacterized membrane protein
MAVSGSESVTINAPLDKVLAAIRDLPGQTAWFPGFVSAEVLETDDQGRITKARQTNDVKVAKDEFEVTFTHSDTGQTWDLVPGSSKVQKANSGSWTLADKGGKTEATMNLSIDTSLPLPGFVQKKTLKDTLKGATQGLKKFCE